MEYIQIKSLECGTGGNSANFETAYEGCSCTGPCTANIGCTCLLYKQVFDAGEKGYGLQCREQIKKGRFVIEYIGEVIGPDEVEKRRSNTNYVLTVKEIFRDHTEVTYIDPSVRGNQSRFINHGCNPNLVMMLVRYGTPQVHVGLFALRDIPAYEELTYNYDASTSEFCLKKCLCGSTDCRLFLPASIS
ncbi:unnamed protein product [Onchocerca ochengi]|uniref:SET domain-containing protein n=1 Tax=Onchocerca ochengi TaxID=42157 RepID=A0A182DWY7_ONCOC|nr:unnamed protein product [Onchocerca ochengi]